MNNNNNNSTTNRLGYSNSIGDYISLFRKNFVLILTISFVIFVGSLLYALLTQDIFVASTVIKINNSQTNILDSPFSDQLGGQSSNDLFIANEIETILNVTIREQVARVIIDSINSIAKTEDLETFFTDDATVFENEDKKLRSDRAIAGLLGKNVEIIQKSGLNFMEIIAESPSPKEAALIANAYASVYKEFNLLESRKQLTQIKEFLKTQKQEKNEELMIAEENIRIYQVQAGGIELDQQARSTIETLTKFDTQKNSVKIDLSIERRKLEEYRKELAKRDPSLTNYFDLQSAQPSIEMLQKEIAKIETQRAIALSGNSSQTNKEKLLNDYDYKLQELRKKLNSDIAAYQSKVYAASPTEMKELSQRIFESEVRVQSLQAQDYQLSQVLGEYEKDFQALPKRSLDLARLEREKLSLEKLFTVLENKYQEALLNEQSVPGNVLVLSSARVPDVPAKPNRIRIALIGLMAGFFIAFVFVYIRSSFDKTVKTPDDLESRGQYVLASIPKFERKIDSEAKNSEIFMISDNELAASEAYRALRTRIQFSKLKEGSKTILITSSAPQEGKTTVAVNLAAGFAQTNKRVVILDCDLRIPRVHSVFKGKASPGFSNFLFGQASMEEILRKSNVVENLFYIAAGTIPSNPSEILGSDQLKQFLDELKKDFDLIIVDSPPVMTITDAEILSHIVDITLLVVFANKTEVDWVVESSGLLSTGPESSFVGTVLNNFDYNTGYRSYHKYNSSKYYKRVDDTKQKEWT